MDIITALRRGRRTDVWVTGRVPVVLRPCPPPYDGGSISYWNIKQRYDGFGYHNNITTVDIITALRRFGYHTEIIRQCYDGLDIITALRRVGYHTEIIWQCYDGVDIITALRRFGSYWNHMSMFRRFGYHNSITTVWISHWNHTAGESHLLIGDGEGSGRTSSMSTALRRGLDIILKYKAINDWEGSGRTSSMSTALRRGFDIILKYKVINNGEGSGRTSSMSIALRRGFYVILKYKAIKDRDILYWNIKKSMTGRVPVVLRPCPPPYDGGSISYWNNIAMLRRLRYHNSITTIWIS